MKGLLQIASLWLVFVSFGCDDDTSKWDSSTNIQTSNNYIDSESTDVEFDYEGIRRDSDGEYVRESDGATVDLDGLVYYGSDDVYGEGATTMDLVCGLQTSERYKLGVLYISGRVAKSEDLSSDCDLGEEILKRPHYRYEAVVLGNVFGLPSRGEIIDFFGDINGGAIQPVEGDVVLASLLSMNDELRLGAKYYLAPPSNWHNSYPYPTSDLLQLPSEVGSLRSHLESLQCPEPNKRSFAQLEEYYFGVNGQCD